MKDFEDWKDGAVHLALSAFIMGVGIGLSAIPGALIAIALAAVFGREMERYVDWTTIASAVVILPYLFRVMVEHVRDEAVQEFLKKSRRP